MVIIQLSRYFSPLNVPDPHPCLVQSQLKIMISLQSSFIATDLFSFYAFYAFNFMLSKVYILIVYFLSMSKCCDI